MTDSAALAILNQTFGVTTASERVVSDSIFNSLPTNGPLMNVDQLHAAATFAMKFGMAVMADPQMFRGCSDEKSTTGYCGTDEAKKRTNDFQGAATNQYQADSIRSLIRSQATTIPMKGVVINGDLTSFGDPGDVGIARFNDYYDANRFVVPVWMGLGNHDISNPVNDCGGGAASPVRNYCAAQMAQFLAGKLVNGNIPRINWDVSTYSENPAQAQSQRNVTGSLAYSWNIRDFHFVQMNNYPTYARSFTRGYNSGISSWDINLLSAKDWLVGDLNDFRGMKTILNWHYFYDDNLDTRAEVKEILRPYRQDILAIFVGHIHSWFGKLDSIDYPDKSIPVIYSGSPIHGRYIHAIFESIPDACQLTTQVKKSVNDSGTGSVVEDAGSSDGTSGTFTVTCR